MLSLSGFLCRIWRPTGRSKADHERATDNAAPEDTQESVGDDLTAVRGIGIATQNRLNVSGIKSYAQLAKVSADEVRKILGIKARGAKVEDWIAQAQEMAKKQ